MSVQVTLTFDDLRRGARVGIDRRVRALEQGRVAVYGDPTRDLWGIDVEGALAECACAVYFDAEWADKGRTDFEDGDVDGLHVRSTTLDEGCLIVHQRDHEDGIYVLVTGRAPTYTLRGWMYGHEAKQPDFWRDGKRPAYFVPQRYLHDIVVLKEMP